MKIQKFFRPDITVHAKTKRSVEIRLRKELVRMVKAGETVGIFLGLDESRALREALLDAEREAL